MSWGLGILRVLPAGLLAKGLSICLICGSLLSFNFSSHDFFLAINSTGLTLQSTDKLCFLPKSSNFGPLMHKWNIHLLGCLQEVIDS